jgi:hypothetical protein
MTLREKFKPFAYFSDGNNSMEREYQREDNAIECEQIADDYAIDFLNWYISKSSIMDKKYIGKTSNELLEIFKKEL